VPKKYWDDNSIDASDRDGGIPTQLPITHASLYFKNSAWITDNWFILSIPHIALKPKIVHG